MGINDNPKEKDDSSLEKCPGKTWDWKHRRLTRSWRQTASWQMCSWGWRSILSCLSVSVPLLSYLLPLCLPLLPSNTHSRETKKRTEITLLYYKMLPEADRCPSSQEGDYIHVHQKAFICSVKRSYQKICAKRVWSTCMAALIKVKTDVQRLRSAVSGLDKEPDVHIWSGDVTKDR